MNSIISVMHQIIAIRRKFKVTFTEPIEESMLCIYCKDVLNDAVQNLCGCRMCYPCVEAYVGFDETKAKNCPGRMPECNSNLLTTETVKFRDNAVNKMVSALTVNCPFNSCEFQCQLKDLSNHLKECIYQDVLCQKCSQTYPVNQRESHEKEYCSMRRVKCDTCDMSMTFADFENIHTNANGNDFCRMLVGYCPNNCGITNRIKLHDHLKECQNRPIPCPIHDSDCKFSQMDKGQIMLHLSESYKAEMAVVISEMQYLKDTLKEVLSRFEIEKLDYNKFTKFQQDTQSMLTNLQKEVEMLKTKISNQNVQSVSIGTFIWKIDNFRTLKADAEANRNVSLISNPFYSKEFGYKLCLKIYPFGDGIGHSTHLSVFFALMKGEYDDVLKWPFNYRITITLLNQVNSSRNYCQNFKPTGESICYQKPQTECNIASGSPKFILLEKLLSDQGFCNNNTIFLRIDVLKD